MDKILVLTHGEDVDGIISAALLKMHYGILDFIFVANKNQQTVFENLLTSNRDMKSTTIIVTDLVLKDSLIDAPDNKKSILEKIIGGCQRFIWIDHHSRARQVIFERLGGEFDFGGDIGYCSSKLVFERFRFGSNEVCDYAIRLAIIAQANDYPERGGREVVALGNKLQRAITCLNYDDDIKGLGALVDMLAYNNEWNIEVEKILSRYRSILISAEDDFQKSQDILCASGFSFATAYVHPILPQKETLRLMREKYQGQTDGCIAFFGAPVNNVMFSKDPIRNSFIAQDFCVFMWGGGRDGDGGYSLKFDLTPETMPRAVQELTLNLASFLALKGNIVM